MTYSECVVCRKVTGAPKRPREIPMFYICDECADKEEE